MDLDKLNFSPSSKSLAETSEKKSNNVYGAEKSHCFLQNCPQKLVKKSQRAALALTVWAVFHTLFNVGSLSYALSTSTHFELLYMNIYYIGLSGSAVLCYVLGFKIYRATSVFCIKYIEVSRKAYLNFN